MSLPSPRVGRRLSAHFTSGEFDCRDGSLASPSRLLIACLENLRRICDDRPLTIVSGYRSPDHNRNVGGAAASQHLYNRAVDIPRGYATVAQARRAGFTGVGCYGNWATHVDVRPGNYVEWRY